MIQSALGVASAVSKSSLRFARSELQQLHLPVGRFFRTVSTKPSKRLQYDTWLSTRSRARKPSAIRALQPLVSLPGMISLGGGMPNPSTFPFKKMTVELKDGGGAIQLEGEVLARALQYSPTNGLPELVKLLKDMQEEEHSPPAYPEGVERDLLISGGSQDALSKAFEMLVGPRDSILVENPTYSGSLAALGPLSCRLCAVETDKDGIIPSSLENILRRWDVSHGSRPRVLYTIPTGGNPTGRSLTEERKRQIYEIASRPENNLLILEDDPYYYLQLDSAKRTPSFLSMDVDGRVLRFDSFSKVLSSGLRIGFATGPKPLIERIELHTQSAQLHTSGVSQAIVLELLKKWKSTGDGQGWETHLQNVQDIYRGRRDAFVRSAEKHLSGLAEWQNPDAGMFVWMKLLGVKDSKQLIQEKAVEAKVLLVPGSSFVPNGGPSPYVRAAFSTATEEDMDTALSRLAELLKNQ